LSKKFQYVAEYCIYLATSWLLPYLKRTAFIWTRSTIFISKTKSF